MKHKIVVPLAASIIMMSFIVIKTLVSQKDLDSSTTPVKISVTGTPQGDVSISHDGRSVPPDSSFRDSYTNMSSPKRKIEPGTIFTKRAYVRKKDGSKGELAMLFAMIKRENGYYPHGGDWEYVSIPADKSTDYKTHPNGMLPDKADDKMRGKIEYCGSCHMRAGGNDFVFTNDDLKPKCGPKMKCNPCNPKTKCNPCNPKKKCNPCKPKNKCNPCNPK